MNLGPNEIYEELSKMATPQSGDFKFTRKLRDSIFIYLSPQLDLNENEGVEDDLTHSQKLDVAKKLNQFISKMPRSKEMQSAHNFINEQIDALQKVIVKENAQRQAQFTTIPDPQPQKIEVVELPKAQNKTQPQSETEIDPELQLSEEDAKIMLANLNTFNETEVLPEVKVAPQSAQPQKSMKELNEERFKELFEAIKQILTQNDITNVDNIIQNFESLKIEINLSKLDNPILEKKMKEALMISGALYNVNDGKLLIKYGNKKQDKESNFSQLKEGELAARFKSSMQLIPQKDNLLNMAVDFSKNSLLWMMNDEEPAAGKEAKEVTVKRVLAGRLIVGTENVKVLKGKSYSYPVSSNTDPTPGLTAAPLISSKQNQKPLLYGSMAPDQYYMKEAMKLNTDDIDKIKDKLFKDNPNADSIVNKLKGFEFHTYDGMEYGVQKILNEGGVKFNLKDLQNILFHYKAEIGQKHVERVAAQMGVDQYAVISIEGHEHSETIGFGLSSKTKPVEASSHVVSTSKTEQKGKIPTVATYEGYNPKIAKHLVIQSDRNLNNNPSKIPIFGLDMEQLIRFYDETIAKGIPVAVNCTDGIDRTGIVMFGMVMLDQFKNGEDITSLPEHEQKQKLNAILEGLREARGNRFLRQEHDIVRGVLLGYNLIATQKQLNFQKENINKIQNPALKNLMGNASSIEPSELKNKIEEINIIEEKDKVIVQEWLKHVDNRIAVEAQFTLSTLENSSYISPIRDMSASKDPIAANKVAHNIEKAPIELYNELIASGFDVASYKSKDGKSIYHYATQTFLANPSGENLKHMAELLKNGRITAHRAVEETLTKNDMDSRIIGMVLQISEDKKQGLKAVKQELKDMNPKDKAKVKAQLKILSSYADKDSKKIFKQLESALKRSLQTKIRDKLNLRKAVAKAEPIQAPPAAVQNQPINEVSTPPVDQAASQKQQPQPAALQPTASSTPAVSNSAALTQAQLEDTLNAINDQHAKALELIKRYPKQERKGGRPQVFGASSMNDMSTFARRLANILNIKESEREYGVYHTEPLPKDKRVEDIKKSLVALKNDIEKKHPNSELAKAVRSCIEEINKPVQKQEAQAGNRASFN